MKIEGRRFERYPVNTRVRAVTRGESFEGRLKDVSAGAAAITIAPSPVFDNAQFVELHMEGIGNRRASVVRDLPDGYALEFEEDEEQKRRMAEELKKFRRSLGDGLA